MKHETPAAERIRKARTALLLDHPFFGSLLFRLKSEEDRAIPTMATNGVVLRYNPVFVDTLNAATLAGVLAHEVMHPALQHHTRRAKRDPRRWNEACDYAINPLLLDAGLSLPDDVLVDPRFRGMSAEQMRNHSPMIRANRSRIRALIRTIRQVTGMIAGHRLFLRARAASAR
jgi:predicted metal-dependent peptidase